MQTAVEWLEQQLKSTYNKEGKLPLAYTLDLIKQAKQMEKEQIISAFDIACEDEDRIGEEYYNETYDRTTDTE